jgi:hypothetical protein
VRSFDALTQEISLSGIDAQMLRIADAISAPVKWKVMTIGSVEAGIMAAFRIHSGVVFNV